MGESFRNYSRIQDFEAVFHSFSNSDFFYFLKVSAFLKFIDNILYYIGKLKVLGFEFQSSGFGRFSNFHPCNFDKTWYLLLFKKTNMYMPSWIQWGSQGSR